jgi:hypothetical protein
MRQFPYTFGDQYPDNNMAVMFEVESRAKPQLIQGLKLCLPVKERGQIFSIAT